MPGRKWREADRFDVGISFIGDAYNRSHFDHRAAGSPGAQLDRDGLVRRNRDRALIPSREAKWQLHCVWINASSTPRLAEFTREQRCGIEHEGDGLCGRCRVSDDQRASLATFRKAYEAVGRTFIRAATDINGVDQVSAAAIGPFVDGNQRLPFRWGDGFWREVPLTEQGPATVVHQDVVTPVPVRVCREGHLAGGVTDNPVGHDGTDGEPRPVCGIAPHPPEIDIPVGARLRPPAQLGGVCIKAIIPCEQPNRIGMIQPAGRVPGPVGGIDKDAFFLWIARRADKAIHFGFVAMAVGWDGV